MIARILFLLPDAFSHMNGQEKTEVETEIESITGKDCDMIASNSSDNELEDTALIAIKRVRERRTIWIKSAEIKLCHFYAVWGKT